MQYRYNDGGRQQYISQLSKRDCAVRAIAIAANLPYRRVYQNVLKFAPTLEKDGWNANDPLFFYYMRSLGFIRVDGGVTEMRHIPHGRVIAHTTGHLTAIIDGVINDTVKEYSKAVSYYWLMGKSFYLIRDNLVINTAPLNGSQALAMRTNLSRYQLNDRFIHLKAVEF